MWRMYRLGPRCFKSIATVSLNSQAKGKPTACRKGGFLCFAHTSQIEVVSLIVSKTFVSEVPAFLIRLIKRSAVGCENYLCNFLTLFFKSDPMPTIEEVDKNKNIIA